MADGMAVAVECALETVVVIAHRRVAFPRIVEVGGLLEINAGVVPAAIHKRGEAVHIVGVLDEERFAVGSHSLPRVADGVGGRERVGVVADAPYLNCIVAQFLKASGGKVGFVVRAFHERLAARFHGERGFVRRAVVIEGRFAQREAGERCLGNREGVGAQARIQADAPDSDGVFAHCREALRGDVCDVALAFCERVAVRKHPCDCRPLRFACIGDFAGCELNVYVVVETSCAEGVDGHVGGWHRELPRAVALRQQGRVVAVDGVSLVCAVAPRHTLSGGPAGSVKPRKRDDAARRVIIRSVDGFDGRRVYRTFFYQCLVNACAVDARHAVALVGALRRAFHAHRTDGARTAEEVVRDGGKVSIILPQNAADITCAFAADGTRIGAAGNGAAVCESYDTANILGIAGGFDGCRAGAIKNDTSVTLNESHNTTYVS